MISYFTIVIKIYMINFVHCFTMSNTVRCWIISLRFFHVLACVYKKNRSTPANLILSHSDRKMFWNSLLLHMVFLTFVQYIYCIKLFFLPFSPFVIGVKTVCRICLNTSTQDTLNKHIFCTECYEVVKRAACSRIWIGNWQGSSTEWVLCAVIYTGINGK